MAKIILTAQEKKWLLTPRLTRKTDNKEILIYPMGAERFLASALKGTRKPHYPIRKDIENKDILVIPGYGNNGFLMAESGARSVTVFDKDPVTIAWLRAFQLYYHYREFDGEGRPYPTVGELLHALTTWYPPLLYTPRTRMLNGLLWLLSPKNLRRFYLFYLIKLVARAITKKIDYSFQFALPISFHVGELQQVSSLKKSFASVYVPYLLGVVNGVEKDKAIVDFILSLIKAMPQTKIIVTPTQNIREYPLIGSRYFVTSSYEALSAIPDLKPFIVDEDQGWFKTQGLVVFANNSHHIGH